MYCHEVPKCLPLWPGKTSSFVHFCLNFLPEFCFERVAVPPTEIANETLKLQPQEHKKIQKHWWKNKAWCYSPNTTGIIMLQATSQSFAILNNSLTLKNPWPEGELSGVFMSTGKFLADKEPPFFSFLPISHPSLTPLKKQRKYIWESPFLVSISWCLIWNPLNTSKLWSHSMVRICLNITDQRT